MTVQPIVSVRDLTVTFKGPPDVHAVNGVSFDLAPGEFWAFSGNPVPARA